MKVLTTIVEPLSTTGQQLVTATIAQLMCATEPRSITSEQRTSNLQSNPSSTTIIQTAMLIGLQRKLLEQALRVYGGRLQLRHERARTSFVMGHLFKQLGESNIAATHLKEAFMIYKDLRQEDTRPIEALTDDDFDDLVSFWSK